LTVILLCPGRRQAGAMSAAKGRGKGALRGSTVDCPGVALWSKSTSSVWGDCWHSLVVESLAPRRVTFEGDLLIGKMYQNFSCGLIFSRMNH
jgi:hypothetical protein